MPLYANILRWIYLLAAPLVTLAYSIFYWTLSHSELAAWYRRLNPYFYEAETWESELFTPSVKLQGNWWCLVAVIAAFVLAFSQWKKSLPEWPKLLPKRRTYLVTISIALLGFLSIFLAFANTAYAADEVFSALNFAGIPYFQTISHYPLPNNHILFNFINRICFFWSDDQVFTGRFISLFSYLLVLISTWFFIKKWSSNALLQCLILLLLGLQFPVWGFAFQARGYEMVLLCSCISLFSFLAYANNRKSYFLTIHTLANVAGIMTLPTYLYWWLGLLFASAILQIASQKLDRSFIRASITGFACSLLLALPLLSFSGISALADNRYVQTGDVSPWQFLANLNNGHYLDGLFFEWFCIQGQGVLIGISCLLLPILLFVHPKKNPYRKTLGIAYYSIMLAFLFMATVMAKLPFYRNLIAHGYLVLLVNLITILPLFRTKLMQAILGVGVFLAIVFFAYKNHALVPGNLYYYDVHGEIKANEQKQLNILPNQPIYLESDGFYWWYILRKNQALQQISIHPNRPKPKKQPSNLHFPASADSSIYQIY